MEIVTAAPLENTKISRDKVRVSIVPPAKAPVRTRRHASLANRASTRPATALDVSSAHPGHFQQARVLRRVCSVPLRIFPILLPQGAMLVPMVRRVDKVALIATNKVGLVLLDDTGISLRSLQRLRLRAVPSARKTAIPIKQVKQRVPSVTGRRQTQALATQIAIKWAEV